MKYKRIKKSQFINSPGKAQFVILFIVIFIAFMLTGGIVSTSKRTPPTDPTSNTNPIVATGQCCESGDGDACQPLTGDGETITFRTQEYGLLKRDVSFQESIYHLENSGETDPEGNPIILNSSSRYNNVAHRDLPQCLGGDALVTRGIISSGQYAAPGCLVVPDDQIIYVCRENCTTTPNVACDIFASQGLTCFGQPDSRYDAHFRLDGSQVPDEIRFCQDTSNTAGQPPVQTVPQQIITPPQGELNRPNLHLNTFGIGNVTPAPQSNPIVPWLSPWCKPAVYLYPKTASPVHVQVAPLGKLTYTDPLYPKDGWRVVAYPHGQIVSNNTSYEYLYYEAEVPDDAYQKPSEGFVIKRNELKGLLEKLLLQLGLNSQETEEFVKYWSDVLPQSPFIFIGVIPQAQINTLAPLTVTPEPDTVIRVTLYFEALEGKIEIQQPKIQTPVRSGFTVVEWGGIFKRNEKYNFSCFM